MKASMVRMFAEDYKAFLFEFQVFGNELNALLK